MTVFVLWPLLTMLWVGLQCVIVVYPDYTHSLLYILHKDRAFAVPQQTCILVTLNYQDSKISETNDCFNMSIGSEIFERNYKDYT